MCVYFFVLLVEALLERELRQAMERGGGSRPCRCTLRGVPAAGRRRGG